MRLLKVSLFSLALIVLGASAASAITIRLENGPLPTQVEVYLDMEGDQTAGVDTLVALINVGVDSADADITYLGAEPPPTLDAIGGSPGILLSFSPFAFLAPTVAYGQESISAGVPPNTTRALVDFFSSTPTNGSSSGTENVLMATLNYDAPVDGDSFNLEFGVDGGFFADDGTGTVVLINDRVDLVINVPEPAGAALGFAALGTLGLLRRTSHQR